MINKIIYTLIGCFALIVITVVIVFSTIAPEEKPPFSPPVDPGSTLSYNEVIDNIKWTVYYNSVSKKITSINATHSYNERSSEYYKQLAYKHGDNTIYIRHNITLNGEPLEENNWFKITKTEMIINGWDYNDILNTSTIRMEQKIIFTIPET